MSVQVQLDADRYLRAYDGAGSLDQVTLAVQAVLSGHGAMQHQHHGLHGHRGTQVVQQFVAQLLIDRLTNRAQRHRSGKQAFDHLPSLP